MSSRFSDPEWWPQQTPKPPRSIPTATIVFGTLVPLVVAVVVVVLLVGHNKSDSAAATGRSIAAFQACMDSQGASTPSERSNSRYLDEDAAACKAHLPKGMALPSFTPAAAPDPAARQAFDDCMRAALSNLRGRGPGGFGGGPSRTAMQNAFAICRKLAGGGSGRGRTQPPQTTPTTTTVPAIA
jgi:hypothetical protein